MTVDFYKLQLIVSMIHIFFFPLDFFLSFVCLFSIYWRCDK